MTLFRRNRKRILTVLTVVILLSILAAEAGYIWPRMHDAWNKSGDIQWVWILGCGVFAILSMDSYAQVQRVLFRSAGVKVKQRESLAVILASNSISQTMPGGQILAPAFVYKETRRWGATSLVASWQLVMSGLLAGAGLAVLGLGGAVLAGVKYNPFSAIFGISGFVLFFGIVQHLARNPSIAESIVLSAVRRWNKLRKKADFDEDADKVSELFRQVSSVRLSGRDFMAAFGWSLFNWVADVACLAFACWAAGGQPSISGLMVAYATGKTVGTLIPLLPGGLGVVDLTLVPALTAAGMTATSALAAVLVYRAISYIMISLIGWVVIAFRYREVFKSSRQAPS